MTSGTWFVFDDYIVFIYLHFTVEILYLVFLSIDEDS